MLGGATGFGLWPESRGCVERMVQETVRVPRGFDDVCDVLGVMMSDGRDPFEGLATVEDARLQRHADGTASRRLMLRPTFGQRRLVSLDGRLVLHSIIPRGPMAVTALSIVGHITEPASQALRFDGRLSSRRMVERAARDVLDGLAATILDALPAPTAAIPDPRRIRERSIPHDAFHHFLNEAS